MPETLITITQVQVGHVLGKGGSTLKDIQERTGAALEIVDGPKVKITADDDAKLRAAEAEVNKIVANQENPDYEGPEGMRLRKETNALGDKRSALFDEATAKRNAGDHAGANELVAAAKEAGEQMQAKHREAAIAISLHNNEAKGKGEDYFDMHGLREEEAMTILEERVAVLEAKVVGTVTEFEVIPGAGHHSAPGAQKLKGATEAYFKRKGFQYTEASAGSFIAQVPGKVEEMPAFALVPVVRPSGSSVNTSIHIAHIPIPEFVRRRLRKPSPDCVGDAHDSISRTAFNRVQWRFPLVLNRMPSYRRSRCWNEPFDEACPTSTHFFTRCSPVLSPVTDSSCAAVRENAVWVSEAATGGDEQEHAGAHSVEAPLVAHVATAPDAAGDSTCSDEMISSHGFFSYGSSCVRRRKSLSHLRVPSVPGLDEIDTEPYGNDRATPVVQTEREKRITGKTLCSFCIV